MDKRYQVFVSSTYADLKDERQKVIQALMEMDCIPAGMEIFPAADEEQWEFIKRVIDDCDYYIVIIGGRYGSLTAEGVSYTEKEYEYAKSKGIKVLAFLHKDPSKIESGKTDEDPELKDKLNAFRDKLSETRLVKFWNNAEELPGAVALSLTKTIKIYPAVGWVRASTQPDRESLVEINSLQKENSNLRARIKSLESDVAPTLDNLASLDSSLSLIVEWNRVGEMLYTKRQVISLTWRRLFALVAPHLREYPNDTRVRLTLGSTLLRVEQGISPDKARVQQDDFLTIRTQLEALNLIELKFSNTTKGSTALFWGLTTKGSRVMFESRTIKQDVADADTNEAPDTN